MKKLTGLFVLLFFWGINTYAQQTPDDSSTDLFYREGKLYVVITVLLIIFSGICIYLYRLDKSITKLEKERED